MGQLRIAEAFRAAGEVGWGNQDEQDLQDWGMVENQILALAKDPIAIVLGGIVSRETFDRLPPSFRLENGVGQNDVPN